MAEPWPGVLLNAFVVVACLLAVAGFFVDDDWEV